MKIIHCADLHLDSRLMTNLDRVRAKQRRDELLRNFARLAEYAEKNAVEAVLISGDLFDRDTVSALAKNTVLAVVEAHPSIRFYYLRGNHDTGDCLASRGDHPAGPRNLFLFDHSWKTYREGQGGNIAITGMELPDSPGAFAAPALRLDPDCFNILMLHGQIIGESAVSAGGEGRPADTGSAGRKKAAGLIDLRALRGRGIDYLALGHIHTCKSAPLDSRGLWCYPGCLEGRGFDESGPHGFVLLEIDEIRHSMRRHFIPFARRTMYRLRVDVTGCLTTAQMSDLVEDAVREAGCSPGDMADVTLCGQLDVDCEKDTGYLRSNLEAHFYFARLTDATVLRIDPADYLYDESLRGEFVRLVMADPGIPEAEKTAVIRCGFQAMDGEEPV